MGPFQIPRIFDKKLRDLTTTLANSSVPWVKPTEPWRLQLQKQSPPQTNINWELSTSPDMVLQPCIPGVPGTIPGV